MISNNYIMIDRCDKQTYVEGHGDLPFFINVLFDVVGHYSSRNQGRIYKLANGKFEARITDREFLTIGFGPISFNHYGTVLGQFNSIYQAIRAIRDH